MIKLSVLVLLIALCPVTKSLSNPITKPLIGSSPAPCACGCGEGTVCHCKYSQPFIKKAKKK